MRMRWLVGLFSVLLIFVTSSHQIVDMYENEAEIEVLDKTTFDSVVYESEKASFVEFYAHWLVGVLIKYTIMAEILPFLEFIF